MSVGHDTIKKCTPIHENKLPTSKTCHRHRQNQDKASRVFGHELRDRSQASRTADPGVSFQLLLAFSAVSQKEDPHPDEYL